MHTRQRVDRLEFDDNGIFNHEIRLKDGFEVNTAIRERNSSTDVSLQAGFVQLNRKAFAINGFEKTRTEVLVHFDPATDDGLGQRLMLS